MSAFLCNYETIAKAASCGPEDALGESFHALVLLNADGYEQRYSHHSTTRDEVHAFCTGSATFRPAYCADRVAAYFALSCVLYQASEGDVPDDDPYKKWDAIHDEIAHEIAHSAALDAGLKWNG